MQIEMFTAITGHLLKTKKMAKTSIIFDVHWVNCSTVFSCQEFPCIKKKTHWPNYQVNEMLISIFIRHAWTSTSVCKTGFSDKLNKWNSKVLVNKHKWFQNLGLPSLGNCTIPGYYAQLSTDFNAYTALTAAFLRSVVLIQLLQCL